MRLPYFKEDVFRVFNASHHAGWRALNDETSRQMHNNSDVIETCGRHSIVTSQKIREIERIFEEEGFEARALT